MEVVVQHMIRKAAAGGYGDIRILQLSVSQPRLGQTHDPEPIHVKAKVVARFNCATDD